MLRWRVGRRRRRASRTCPRSTCSRCATSRTRSSCAACWRPARAQTYTTPTRSHPPADDAWFGTYQPLGTSRMGNFPKMPKKIFSINIALGTYIFYSDSLGNSSRKGLQTEIMHTFPNLHLYDIVFFSYDVMKFAK